MLFTKTSSASALAALAGAAMLILSSVQVQAYTISDDHLMPAGSQIQNRQPAKSKYYFGPCHLYNPVGCATDRRFHTNTQRGFNTIGHGVNKVGKKVLRGFGLKF